MMRFVPLFFLPFLLAACGLQPLYGGGTGGVVAQNVGRVQIDPIEGKAGYLMRGALQDRLQLLTGGNTSGAEQYILKIRLDDQLEGFGLLANDTVSRERRTLRARYQLVDAASGDTVLDATAGSDAGIDVVSSEYATIAAENTALENLSREVANQIVERLSLYARTRAAPDN